MKILFVNPFFGEAFGTERVLADSCRFFRNTGHQVFFVVEEVRGAIPKNDGIHLVQGLFDLSLLTGRKRANEIIHDFFAKIELCAPDVVILADTFHPRIVRQLVKRYPTIFIAHSVSPTCPASHRLKEGKRICKKKSGLSCLLSDARSSCMNFRNFPIKAFAVLHHQKKKRGLQKAHRIATVSESLKRIFIEDGWNESQIDVVYNPIEVLAYFNPIADAPKNLLVTTSRMVGLKGLSFLVEALAIIPHEEWTLWMVGDGPIKSDLERLVKSKGLESRIIFKGKAGYLETQRIVGSSAIFLQPNVAPEAFGIGMAEAMGLGIPVIASDVPALNELIDDRQNGILVPPANPEALAQAISQLLNDKELRKKISSKAREKVRKLYTPQTHTQLMESCITKAMQAFHASDAKSSAPKR